MTAISTIPGETHFDRGSWLTLGVVAAFFLLSISTTLYILNLPTDGWQIPYNTTPLVLANFTGDWPTPLQVGDQVLTVDGASVGGGGELSPLALAYWKTGQRVTYAFLRDGRRLDLPVTLYHSDFAGILRSFWFTIKDVPIEWSWSIISFIVFFLRPRNAAARLMFLTFVPHNIVTKLVWAATTVSQNFAPPPVFYLNAFSTAFWGYLFMPSIILLALSFPTHIFPLTRWPRALPLLLYGLPLGLTLVDFVIHSDLLAAIILVTDAILVVLALLAALLNTRKFHRSAILRAQSVWVIFGFILSVIPIVVGYLLDYYRVIILPNINWFYNDFTILVLPFCLAIAITRYHLFDIYLIIRRTLQYTLLTLLLGAIYFAGIVLLQFIFSTITGYGATGQTKDVFIVFSTLAIAALFTPLRRRVQAFIDQRFFRSKYNAQQILANFAISAREVATLELLTSDLLKVVAETLQPKQMSLWVKPIPNK